MSGDPEGNNAAPVHGSLGVGNVANSPGGREGNLNWIDSSGNLWLFGGYGYDTVAEIGYLGDFWKYDPTACAGAGCWAWMGGNKFNDVAGDYGVKGTGSTANIPGTRGGGASWIDSSGNFFLFGGEGYDNADNVNMMNDLWRYEPANGKWTWLHGSDLGAQNGTYGTKGTPHANNTPGSRDTAVSWVDMNGSFWLFGGYAVDSVGADGVTNDLWRYNSNTNQWTWVNGPNIINDLGTYGTKGVEASGNSPPARHSSLGWTDVNGNLWLMGGHYAYMNDLWKYSLSTNRWTWMSGANTGIWDDGAGVYGTKGVGSTSNLPSPRAWGVSFFDTSTGDLFLFGGLTFDEFGIFEQGNDLWKTH